MCPWLFSQTSRSHRRLNPSPCYQPLCPEHLSAGGAPHTRHGRHLVTYRHMFHMRLARYLVEFTARRPSGTLPQRLGWAGWRLAAMSSGPIATLTA